MRKKTTSKPLSLAQLRSRTINGVIFVLHGIVKNLEIQSDRKLPTGFARTRTFLREASRNIELAIDAIKKER